MRFEQREREIEQKERQIELEREKFETDAVEKAMQHVATIKQVSSDHSLSSDVKRAQLRRLLFPQVASTQEATP